MKVTSKRDQYTVVLENIYSQNKVFGEGMSALREHVDRRFDKLDSELEIMKTELALIRHSLITREEFKFLETRVHRLEKVISRR